MTATRPSLPEHQLSSPPPDSGTVLKTPAEIAQLKSAFEQASKDVATARRMVSAATPGEGDPDSPQYQTVQRRKAAGNETLETIRIKSDINALGLKEVELAKEQEYRQAEAEIFRSQGLIPGNDRMILGVLNQQQAGKVQESNHPVVQYITQRLAQGATVEILRTEAQQRIAEYDRLWTMTAILAGLKKGTVSFQSEEYATHIKPWVDNGWTTTQMEAWLKDSIEKKDNENLQRVEYLLDLARLPKIPLEKEQALEQKKALRAQLDTQALASARHELQQQVSADINSILYGEYKSLPSPQAELLSKHLDLLLAYRPLEFAREEIAEVDQIMKIVKQGANPAEVNRILQEVQSGKSWRLVDGAKIGIADDRITMLGQVLYESFHYMNINTPRPPAEFPSYVSAWRRHIKGAVNAQAASQKALAELPGNASSGEKEKTQEWADVRQRWLNLLVTTKGIKRTAFAFGHAPDRDLFVQELHKLADWLTVNNHPQLDPQTAKLVLKINDFVKREFPWVADFPRIGGNRAIFSHDIEDKTWPILGVVEKWAQLPEFQSYLNQQPVFNASLALKRLYEQLPHVPKGQQRQFRKKVVFCIKLEWQKQITRVAGLIEDAIGRIKEDNPLGHTSLGLEKLKQLVDPITSSLELTPEQRYEVNKALAYLWQRAADKNHYIAETFSRSRQLGIQQPYLVTQDLFNYTPIYQFTITWNNPLGIEVRPSSTGDYEKMAAGSENSGGTFWQIKTPGGKIVPVILISPVTNISIEESNKVQLHEQTHSAVSTMYEQSSEYNFPPSQRASIDPGIGLEEITRRYILPRAKSEIAAFLSTGTSIEDIEKILTENPLYDYFQKNRNWWRYQDPSNDTAIQKAKASYINTLKQSLATAKVVKQFLSLSDQELAVLLTILPVRQWQHLFI